MFIKDSHSQVHDSSSSSILDMAILDMGIGMNSKNLPALKASVGAGLQPRNNYTQKADIRKRTFHIIIHHGARQSAGGLQAASA